MLLQLLERNGDPTGELGSVEHRRPLLAAGGEKLCEERLENAEALGCDRSDGSLGEWLPRISPLRPRGNRRRPCVRLGEAGEPGRDCILELVRLQRDRATVLAQDPACEELDVRELGLEDAVLDCSRVRERALHPPGGVVGDGDSGRPDGFADLPRPRNAVLLDVEVRRNAEVALAPGGEADVALGSARP